MVDFRDTPVDHTTKYFSERYVDLINYAVNHADEHLPGGEQPIPVATTTDAGLMSPSDKVQLNALAAADIQTSEPVPIRITLSAANSITPKTNSAVVDQLDTELAGNKFPIVYGKFQAGAYRTVERLNWGPYPLPLGAGAYSVTAQIEGMIGTDETHTSTYILKMIRVPAGGSYDVPIPTVATITVSYSTAYKKYLSTVSAPFVITGLGDTLLCEIVRGTSGDNLAIDSLFCNCFLELLPSNAPVVDFTASDYSLTVGDSFTLTDISTNTPTSWHWYVSNSSGTTNDFYTQNPVVTPANSAATSWAGTLTISLEATNASGTGFRQKVAVITVSATPPVVGDTYGAGTTVDGDTIGGGAGYSDIKITGDHIITSISDFIAHMSGGASEATSGDIVFVPASLTLDFTGLPPYTIPAGVTIASDRGYAGSTGALLKKTQPDVPGQWEAANATLVVGGDGVRVTGCVLEGEMYGLDSWGTYPNTEDESNEASFCVGVYCADHSGFEVDNNEMRGWAYACVNLHNAGVTASVKPHIHHNYMHHCQNRGEGYGVSCYDGDALIEANLFDYNRHNVTGSGISGEKYEARYNIDLGHILPIGGFQYDVHANENHGSDSLDIAGHTYLIHHNTAVQGNGVYQKGFFHLRDNPTVGAYVYNNLINTDWGSGNNDMGFPTVICQTNQLSTTWARIFCTDNRWKGTIYPTNATIVWFQAG